MRDKPAGTVRITCGEHVLRTTLLPKLTSLQRDYSDIKVEFDINYGLRDIVANRFDAGVRLDDTIVGARDTARCWRCVQRVDANRAGEPLGVAFDGRLRQPARLSSMTIPFSV